jgi:hypothetical protein
LYVLLFVLLIFLLKNYEVVVRIPRHRFMSLLDKMSPACRGIACIRSDSRMDGPTAMSPVTVTVQPASPAFEVNNGVVVKAIRESQ